MAINGGIIALSVVGVFLLCVVCRIFIEPLKWLLKFGLSCLMGIGGICVVNLIGSLFSFHIALNPLSGVISGVLGAPGIVLLGVLQKIL